MSCPLVSSVSFSFFVLFVVKSFSENISPAETRSAAEGGHMNAKLPMS